MSTHITCRNRLFELVTGFGESEREPSFFEINPSSSDGMANNDRLDKTSLMSEYRAICQGRCEVRVIRITSLFLLPHRLLEVVYQSQNVAIIGSGNGP